MISKFHLLLSTNMKSLMTGLALFIDKKLPRTFAIFFMPFAGNPVTLPTFSLIAKASS